MEKIKIKKFIIDEIKEHGLKDAPIEACGYLAGIKRDNIILKSIKMKNVDNSPEHFSFDVKEQFAVMKNLRNEGLEILGVYHTHPITAARMSEEDIRLANDINLIYTHTEERNLHVVELNKKLGYKEVRRGLIWDEIIRISLIKHLKI